MSETEAPAETREPKMRAGPQDLSEGRVVRGQEAPGKPTSTKRRRKFILLSGVHIERDGTKYEYDGPDKEVVVDTDSPLDELFMNKFRRVDGDTHPGRDFVDHPHDPVRDAPLAERIPKGIKTQFSGDTDRADRDRAERDVEAAKAPKKGSKKKAEEEEQDEPAGDDVTSQFPDAGVGDLKVFKDGRKYQVYDQSNLGTPLNEEDLTRKEQVEEFVASYIKD